MGKLSRHLVPLYSVWTFGFRDIKFGKSVLETTSLLSYYLLSDCLFSDCLLLLSASLQHLTVFSQYVVQRMNIFCFRTI